jgi:hypothetical protein
VRKVALAFFVLALSCVCAAAQSTCPPIVYGAVLTVAQWQSCFASKQDFLGFTPLNPSSIAGTAPITAMFGGGVVSIGINAASASSRGTVPQWPNDSNKFFNGAGAYTWITAGALPAGVGANVLNTQTANYTIQTTDCGKTIQAGTGSTGLFTVTLPVVAGFPSTCVMTIHNSDTGRGKLLSGFPSDFTVGTNILWPNQVGSVGVINGAWQTLVQPGPWSNAETSAGVVTLFVDHTLGSDTLADGLGSGSGAFKTIVHAQQLYQGTVVPGPNTNAIIQTDCGFTENANLSGALVGSKFSILQIIGNPSSPSSCVWNTAGNEVFDYASVQINGYTSRCAVNCIAWDVGKFGWFEYTNMIWGSAGAGGDHISINDNGFALLEGGTNQIGEAACAPNCMSVHVNNTGGVFACCASVNTTMPSVLSYGAFYNAQENSTWNAVGGSSPLGTFSGSGSGAGSSGFKFQLSNGAQLLLGSMVLPGSAAGTVATGACADTVCAPITAAQLPAFSGGDVTSSVGSVVLTLGNIPTATTMAGYTSITGIAAPSSPAAGKNNCYVDSTQLIWSCKNSAGTVSTTIFATSAPSHQFAAGVNANGTLAYTQPAVSDLSGFGTGVATALGVNVGTAGSPVVNGGVLGIPSDLGSAWSQTTPTPTCNTGSMSGSAATSIVRIKQIGKTIFMSFFVTLSNNLGTCAGGVTVTIPFTFASAGSAAAVDQSNGNLGYAQYNGSATSFFLACNGGGIACYAASNSIQGSMAVEAQ